MKNTTLQIELVGAPTTEFSQPFVQKMATAMSISFAKYGMVKDGYPERVDAIASGLKRIDLYMNGGEVKGQKVEPGNLRYLVDAANFFMIESMYPRHPKADWGEDDSNNSPGRANSSGTFSEKDNEGRTQKEKAKEDIQTAKDKPVDLDALERHYGGSKSVTDFYRGRQGD